MKINKYRWIFYCMGCFILPIGLTTFTKAGLGVSPIISTSYCVSEITGLSFGDMTFILYCILVFMQMIIHFIQKKEKTIFIFDLLQIPFSMIFTRFLNIFNLLIPDFSSSTLFIRFIVLAIAIIFTGIGAALMLTTKIVLNPGDGAVAALASFFKKDTGITKNGFDLFMIVLTCMVGLVLKHQIIGIGTGTILAMLFTGRVIAFFNKQFKNIILRLSNMTE
ncbi:YczE/YyaS/YitT family protein [Floccifex sp.]|uniref:YczE/YyaS/YitT family protein n=1 Tax=Floccifex sp. TaxID=2815810 RepID=UPI003F0BDDDA